jgi:HlyD family secretion protein
LLFVSGYDSLAPAKAVAVAPVVQKAGAASTQPGSAVVQAAGWIEPDPFVINASALADGIVEEVLVLESETVEKGDVLVRMVEDDARLELEQAEQEWRLAEANRAGRKPNSPPPKPIGTTQSSWNGRWPHAPRS